MQPKIYKINQSKSATMGSVLKFFSTDTDPAYKDISQNKFWCSFVCLDSSMHKKAEESSIQYSRSVGAALCQWRSQLNKMYFYLIVIDIFVNYCIT